MTATIVTTDLVKPALPTLPTPFGSGMLRVLTNATQAIVSYGTLLSDVALVSDLSLIHSLEDELPGVTYNEAYDFARRLPTIPLVGTYQSNSKVYIDEATTGAPVSFPPSEFPAGIFAADEILEELPFEEGESTWYRADFTNPTVMAKMVRILTREMKLRNRRTGARIFFVDNFSHPSAGLAIDWADSLAYMQALRDAMHSIGFRLAVNIALAPGVPGDYREDFADLGAACDLVYFELPALEAIVEEEADLASLVLDYAAIIDGGAIPIMQTTGEDEEEYTAESAFIAGLAMILNGPFVAYPLFLPPEPWFRWPFTYKAPTGAIVQDGTELSRVFGNAIGGSATITVDCAARTVEIT